MATNTTALGAAKRRWWVIILLAAIGGALGALPEPERVDEESELRSFTATHTLLQNTIDQNDQFSTSSTGVSPSQVALLATTGEVPRRVADEIGYTGNPAELASQVIVEFDFQTGALTVTTTQPTAETAEQIANAFADTLTTYLVERQDVLYQQRLAAYIDRLADLEQELDDLTDQLALDPEDPILTAQRDAVSRQYSVAFEQNQILTESPTLLAFTTLERAQAIEVTSGGGGLSAPRSRTTRGLMGAIAGAGVGFGLAIVLGLLDRKIRTRDQAEDLLGLRARVVIPRVKDSNRGGLVVVDGRHDPLSDSYRTVRNVLGFVYSGLPDSDRARVAVVVSPGPGEGKTSLAANLAAAFVETGQRTIAVNTDFRRPRLANVLTEGAMLPLPFVVEDIDTLQPRWLLSDTVDKNLKLMDLSSLRGSAGELVRTTARNLPRIAETADAVVVDTSPVGATAEVLDVVPLADVLVVVVRVGQTNIAVAERAIAILRDTTTAPMILVLTGMKQDRAPYYEYQHRRRPAERPAVTSGDEAEATKGYLRRRREKVG